MPGISKTLGQVLQQRRLELGYSTYDVARRTGVAQSNVVRAESGAIASPRPELLTRLAEALEIPAYDLFVLAGHSSPSSLPQFTPYMRAKYHDLTPEDVTAIQAYAQKIAKRRGVSLTGPKPGEDE